MLIATFQLQYGQSSSGGVVDCLRVAVCSTLARCYWCISILIIISVVRQCSLIGPYKSAVVLFDRGYSSLGNFDSAIPMDVSGIKSYTDSLFDPTFVQLGVTINKLNLAPNRNMHRFVSVIQNRKGLSMRKPYVSTFRNFLQLVQNLFFLSVVHVRILTEAIDEYSHDTKYRVQLIHIFKLTRGVTTIGTVWILNNSCRCPLLLPGKQYLLMGSLSFSAAKTEPKAEINRQSYVEEWRGSMIRRLPQLHKRCSPFTTEMVKFLTKTSARITSTNKILFSCPMLIQSIMIASCNAGFPLLLTKFE